MSQCQFRPCIVDPARLVPKANRYTRMSWSQNRDRPMISGPMPAVVMSHALNQFSASGRMMRNGNVCAGHTPLVRLHVQERSQMGLGAYRCKVDLEF